MDHECVCSKQTGEDGFTEEQWKSIDEITQKYKGKSGALIPVLEEVQRNHGLSAGVCPASGCLRIELATQPGLRGDDFLLLLHDEAEGKHQIRICPGEACHVRGAKRNLDHLTQALNLKPGECTEDRQFSMEVVRCLGACGLAPVM